MKHIIAFILIINLSTLAFEPRYTPMKAEINAGIGLKSFSYETNGRNNSITPSVAVFNAGIFVNPIPINKYFEFLLGYSYFNNFNYFVIENETRKDLRNLSSFDDPIDTTVNCFYDFSSHNINIGFRKNILPYIDISAFSGMNIGVNKLNRINTTFSELNDTLKTSKINTSFFVMPGIEFFIMPNFSDSIFENISFKIGIYFKKEFNHADLKVTDIVLNNTSQSPWQLLCNIGILWGRSKNEKRTLEIQSKIESKSIYDSLMILYDSFEKSFNSGHLVESYNTFNKIEQIRSKKPFKLNNKLILIETTLWNEVQSKADIVSTQIDENLKKYCKSIPDDTVQINDALKMISNYPLPLSSNYKDDLLNRKLEISEQLNFNEIKKVNNISLYKGFVENSNNTALIDEAKDSISAIYSREVDSAFIKIGKDSLECYIVFQKKYPNSKYDSIIGSSIYNLKAERAHAEKAIEERIAKALLKSNLIDSLRSFVISYPNSIYLDTINSRISVLEEKEEKDAEATRIYCEICEDYRAIRYNRSALSDEEEVSRRSGLVNQTAIYKINKTIYLIEKEIADLKDQYRKISGKSFINSNCKECEE